MIYDEMLHAACALKAGFDSPREYIADVIDREKLSCRAEDVDIDVDYGVSSIDIKFDQDEDGWQKAYDSLGHEQEIWTFILPASEEDYKRVGDVRNERGRRMFFFL